ncbi:MAG: hypothetical protein AAF585_01120 [Verrucomicrobiota bacterium]
MDSEDASSQPIPKSPFTIVATSKGLILSTPNGQFLLQSAVEDHPRNQSDPATLLGVSNSDPHALFLQGLNLI